MLLVPIRGGEMLLWDEWAGKECLGFGGALGALNFGLLFVKSRLGTC